MTRKLVGGLLVSFFLAFTGCVDLRIGKPLETDNVKLIKPGETDTSRVQELFGSPRWETSHEGGKIYVYRHVDPEKNVCQELVVSFGEDDRVQSFSKSGL